MSVRIKEHATRCRILAAALVTGRSPLDAPLLWERLEKLLHDLREAGVQASFFQDGSFERRELTSPQRRADAAEYLEFVAASLERAAAETHYRIVVPCYRCGIETEAWVPFRGEAAEEPRCPPCIAEALA